MIHSGRTQVSDWSWRSIFFRRFKFCEFRDAQQIQLFGRKFTLQGLVGWLTNTRSSYPLNLPSPLRRWRGHIGMSSYTMRSETAPFHHHIADQPSSVLLSHVHYQLSRTCKRLMPWQSYFMDGVPCILSPLRCLYTQLLSTAHVVDLETRSSAVSGQAWVLFGMLELAPLWIRHKVESKKWRTQCKTEVRTHHLENKGCKWVGLYDSLSTRTEIHIQYQKSLQTHNTWGRLLVYSRSSKRTGQGRKQ